MDKLTVIAEQIGQQRFPPVHLWRPQQVGRIDIRIDSQGAWWHEGEPILREKLVRLFASILWFEDQRYYLVTPLEKLAIEVVDTPFVVQQMNLVEAVWVAVSNTGDQFFIGDDHPVELRSYQSQLLPYIRVRYDLWARLSRSIYYQWVNLALEQQASPDAALILRSGGYKFEVARP